jgi:hypothetical protein
VRTGNIEFEGVAPGHYELTQGDPPRISDLDASTSQDVDPGVGAPAVRVTGTLHSAAGAPLPENLQVVLDPFENNHGQYPIVRRVLNGEFHFDTVGPGTWTLSAHGDNQTLPVVAIAAGGSTVAGNQITVRDRALNVVATVSSTLTRIQGFAYKDNKGLAGAMIVLVPSQPSAYRALLRRDQSDSDGSFALRDVPAGQYTVVAIEDGWKLDWTDRNILPRYLPTGAAVTVTDRTGAIVRLPAPVPVQPR